MLKRQDFFKSNDQYKLTVLVSAYNQKDYIHQALDSILMQKVNFSYQILVADDGSTDGTSEILQEYANKYDFIQIQRPEKNLGFDKYGFLIHYNQVRLTIDTEYIAPLDGDDYWIDANKLQQQYDFLEKHQECVVVYDSQYLNDTDSPWLQHENLQDFPVTDYSSYSQTATTFYRNVIDFSLQSPFLLSDGGLHCLFLAYGKLGYRKEITSIYRKHPNGIWSSLSSEEQDADRQLNVIVTLGFCIKNHVNPKYIQRELHERKAQRSQLIKRLQDKKRINILMENKLTALYINTFKQTINELGYK